MEIYDLIEVKKNIILDIYNNTVNQTKSINDMDDEKTLSLIDERELMINDIISISLQIKSLGGLPNDLKEVNQEITEYIKKINSIDEYNKKCIEKMQESINLKFKSMNKAKKAITNGYYKVMDYQNGFFVDKKS